MIQLHTQATTRTGRYATLGDPSSARRCWFVLHGYGQLVERVLRRFEGVVPADTYIVAPEGLSRFYTQMPRPDGSHLELVGATWMTRASRDDDIADALHWLEQVRTDTMRQLPPEAQVGVLAFSQGVATAMRWLALETFAPTTFISWGGRPAQDVADSPLQRQFSRAGVTVVAGDGDPFMADEVLNEILTTYRRWQPAATVHRFNGGHHLDPATIATLLA